MPREAMAFTSSIEARRSAKLISRGVRYVGCLIYKVHVLSGRTKSSDVYSGSGPTWILVTSESDVARTYNDDDLNLWPMVLWLLVAVQRRQQLPSRKWVLFNRVSFDYRYIYPFSTQSVYNLYSHPEFQHVHKYSQARWNDSCQNWGMQRYLCSSSPKLIQFTFISMDSWWWRKSRRG